MHRFKSPPPPRRTDSHDSEWEEIGGREAAEKHIKEIRAGRGLESSSVPPDIVENLKQACKILANQLYEAPTHFLLELIQNANDNKFVSDEPTLVFTYKGDYLQVECNEVGFSPENVTAICSLGKSSKKQSGDLTTYVGEKGIGFKSVFRVADVVWVSSRAYNFKFDSNTNLGMITPITDRFPVTKRHSWTSFYLRLRKDQDGTKTQAKIRAELEGFDARLLLFLQKLQTIKISIADGDKRLRTCVFTRTNTQWNEYEMLNLTQDKVMTSYLIYKHLVTDLPHEDRRSGVKSSETVLAFPVDQNKEPLIVPQQVFAFLPIYDFGFSVILQADFLLTANREGVERSNEWNRVLRNGFIQAFGDAAKNFDNTVLRYTWIRYLPESSNSHGFFEKLKGAICESLAQKKILRAWNESIQRPDMVLYIPEKFRDQNGIPLTLSSKKDHVYLSRNYIEADFKYLKRLGVREMDYDDFLMDFRDFLTESFSYFTKKPPEWQSRLAGVLNSLPFNYSLDSLRDLPLIVLRTGKWVSTEVGGIFFQGDLDRTVPGGIDMRIVDPRAASDPARRQLYSHLGVTNFDIISVQEMIVQLHTSESEPKGVSASDLIAQAHFLFSTRWTNYDDVPLWVATDRGLRIIGHKVYIDDDGPHAASRFFSKSRDAFNFLHPDYLLAETKDQADWVGWLEDNIGVAKVPRLVSSGKPYKLSADFNFIINSTPSGRWLELLCEHWEEYGEWLTPKDSLYEEERKGKDEERSGRPDQERLVSELSDIKVNCRDGTSSRLGESFLPIEEFVSAADGLVPFIGIQEPEHERWRALRVLGVGVESNVDFYLLSLSKLADSGSGVKLRRVKLLLNQIEARCKREDEERVWYEYSSNHIPNIRGLISRSIPELTTRREFFHGRKKRLIFVPTPKPFVEQEPLIKGLGIQPVHDQDTYDDDDSDDNEMIEGVWYHVERCLWNGPGYFRENISLIALYPGNKRLFKDILSVSEITLDHFIAEARSFTTSDPRRYMSKILMAMDKYISRNIVWSDNHNKLLSLDMWPISCQSWDPEIQLRSAASDKEWFIADRRHLRDIFDEVVPILDFDQDELFRMKSIFNELNAHPRFMTIASKATPCFEGKVEPSPHHTDLFRSKYRFISRLAKSIDQDTDRDPTLALFKKLEVFIAEEILQQHTILYQNEHIEGKASLSNAIVLSKEDKFEIYMTESYFETDRVLDELVTNLGTALGIDRIKNSLHIHLLSYVLLLEDDAKIADLLDKNGIPRNPNADDDDYDWNGLGEGWRAGSGRGGSTGWGFGRGGTGAGDFGFFVISSINFDQYGHLFAQGKGAGDWKTSGNGFGWSRSGKEPSELGFHVFLPSTGVRMPGAYWKDEEDEEDDELLQFLGELEVAKRIEGILRDKYDATEHWTSAHRAKAKPGIAPFVQEDEKPGPAFTIRDADGIFAAAVAQAYPDVSKLLGRRRPDTWYLEVKASYGGLANEFTLTWEQFERARYLSRVGRGPSQPKPTDAVVLVRVFDVGSDPQLVMFIEPWMQYIEGKLGFQCKGTLKGRPLAEE